MPVPSIGVREKVWKKFETNLDKKMDRVNMKKNSENILNLTAKKILENV